MFGIPGPSLRGSGSNDRYFQHVAFLMNLNGSTVEQSPYAATMTFSGGAAYANTYGTLFGQTPLVFNGSSGCKASVPANPGMNICQSDYTLELWFYVDATGAGNDQSIIARRKTSIVYAPYQLTYLGASAGGKVQLYFSTTGNQFYTPLSTAGAVSTNTWHYFVMTFSGGRYVSAWLDNVSMGTQDTLGANGFSAFCVGLMTPGNSATYLPEPLTLGGGDTVATAFNFKGAIGPMRMTCNVDRYAGSPVIPSTVFPVPVYSDGYVGPLDSYYPSQIKTAHGLSRLLSGYRNGRILRIRRSSDDAEKDILCDPVTGALDTATLSSFVGANDGYVCVWYDQSNSANDMNAMNYNGASSAIFPRLIIAGVYQGYLDCATATGGPWGGGLRKDFSAGTSSRWFQDETAAPGGGTQATSVMHGIARQSVLGGNRTSYVAGAGQLMDDFGSGNLFTANASSGGANFVWSGYPGTSLGTHASRVDSGNATANQREQYRFNGTNLTPSYIGGPNTQNAPVLALYSQIGAPQAGGGLRPKVSGMVGWSRYLTDGEIDAIGALI